MKNYQRQFIALALQHQALRFGEFKLKSGRLSPYFFNIGQLYYASALKTVGECYAAALQRSPTYKVLFGPAYKGIPLVCATTIALQTHYQQDVPYCFNRKEAKDHGEGGMLIGAPLSHQPIMIIDDVITAGTALRECLTLIQHHQGHAVGVMVALDRQEKGQGTHSAIQEIQNQYSIAVRAIITFSDLIEYVNQDRNLIQFKEPLERYRQQYGA